MLYLSVPPKEQKIAKSLGAKWDNEKQSLYVERPEDYSKFGYWIMKETDSEAALILFDWAYFVTEVRECWHCGRMTIVLGFSRGPSVWLDGEPYFDEDGDFIPAEELTKEIVSEASGDKYCSFRDDLCIESLPDAFISKYKDMLERKYNFHKGIEMPSNRECYANHCLSCGKMLNNYPIYGEADSFSRESQITFYEIKLKSSIVVSDGYSFSTKIFETSQFINTPIYDLP